MHITTRSVELAASLRLPASMDVGISALSPAAAYRPRSTRMVQFSAPFPTGQYVIEVACVIRQYAAAAESIRLFRRHEKPTVNIIYGSGSADTEAFVE